MALKTSGFLMVLAKKCSVFRWHLKSQLRLKLVITGYRFSPVSTDSLPHCEGWTSVALGCDWTWLDMWYECDGTWLGIDCDWTELDIFGWFEWLFSIFERTALEISKADLAASDISKWGRTEKDMSWRRCLSLRLWIRRRRLSSFNVSTEKSESKVSFSVSKEKIKWIFNFWGMLKQPMLILLVLSLLIF